MSEAKSGVVTYRNGRTVISVDSADWGRWAPLKQHMHDSLSLDLAEPVPFIIRPTPEEAARFRALLGFGEPVPAPPDDGGVWLVTPGDLRETRNGKGLGSGERYDFDEVP